MVSIIKFTAYLPADINVECAEKEANCKNPASLHVCFEDGSGVTVCRECFDQRVNKGSWITDSAQVLLRAS